MKQVCFKMEEIVLQDVDALLPSSGYPSRSELFRRLVNDWRNQQMQRRKP